MKFSVKWLRDYCPTSLSPEQLAAALTAFGQEVEEVRPHEDDVVLEIEVVPNRPDCLSYVGMARELSYLARAPLIMPAAFVKETAPSTKPPVTIEVLAPDLCPRYVGRVVTNVKVEPSPSWLADRLLAAGIRPINNVVDVTNFVNLELGQPLHAFDVSRLRQGRVLVRRAKPGEKLTLLDGREVELDEETLAICDGGGPVALAGVMGGESSEVTDSTATILIESAYFEPRAVRRAARRFGITTESSYRFERGVDPQGALSAADRAAALIAEIAGGEAVGPAIDVGQKEWPRRVVVLRPHRANALIGLSLSSEEMAVTLRHLYFEVGLDRAENLVVSVPTYRRDIVAEVDLIEELARAYGYDNLPPTLPRGRVPEPTPGGRAVFERETRSALTAAGLVEVYTPSFTSPEALRSHGLDAADAVPVINPVAHQYSLLRPALWPLVADVVTRNGLAGAEGCNVFEIGTTFRRADNGAVEERLHLALALAGATRPRRWGMNAENADAYYAKGVVEALARAWGEEATWRDVNIRVGDATGKYMPAKLEPFGTAHIVELDVTPLADAYVRPHRPYAPLPRFPAVTRDLALVIRKEIAAGEVLAAAASSHKLLREISVFDVYEGPGLPNGSKSLGLRLTYRADDRTLTDEEVNVASQAAVELLREKFGASLRA